MSPAIKFLLGLAAVLAMGWIHHGPLGNGERLIGALEAQAQAAVRESGVPGVAVRLERDPLSRAAILSGPADKFQREGQGNLKGLNDIVGEIEGIGTFRWTNPAPGEAPSEAAAGGMTIPLIAELLILLGAAYLIGIGLGWLLFGRPKKESYL